MKSLLTLLLILSVSFFTIGCGDGKDAKEKKSTGADAKQADGKADNKAKDDDKQEGSDDTPKDNGSKDDGPKPSDGTENVETTDGDGTDLPLDPPKID